MAEEGGSPDAQVAVGVHIAGGDAFLGTVRVPDVPLLDDPAARLRPSQNLAGADQLADFVTRFRQELRRLAPTVVGVLWPRLAANWVYKVAFTRVSLEAAIMIATDAEGIRYEHVKQGDAARAVGTKANQIPDGALRRFGLNERPTYWIDRSYAFAGALYLASELGARSD